MTHCVPDEQYGKLTRKLDEVARRVDEGTIPFEPTMLQLQKLVEGKEFLINEKFIAPVTQRDIARQRNKERNWGFTEDDFVALGKPPAWWPEEKLSVVVLDISLDTVEHTFEEAWYFAASVQPNHLLWNKIK